MFYIVRSLHARTRLPVTWTVGDRKSAPPPARTIICKNIGLKRSSKYPGWGRTISREVRNSCPIVQEGEKNWLLSEEQLSDCPGRGEKLTSEEQLSDCPGRQALKGWQVRNGCRNFG